MHSGYWNLAHRNEMRKNTLGGKDRITKSRKIRSLGEKETYKHMGTIKQVEMKE